MPRLAVIEKQRCNPIGCGNFLCIRVCPMNMAGKECIIKGDDNKPLINEKICTGCGICPNRCPYETISIINLPGELVKHPIHQYGANGFHLYNLPIPIFGKIVGIIGKNGIGKSTAIKILASVLQPNLGDYNSSDYNIDNLIDFFKGTEAHLFFEKVKKKEIKVSYKPQQVDIIPQTYNGKVVELLKRIDEQSKLEHVAGQLEIMEILESNIADISGGELQRVAIAATVLKRADLYIFDEPTSYLDIKQRLNIAKFIRSLANENTAVIVVEHDLIILDYMTDLVHLMYGKENVYGIVSQPKTTKAGINIYLSGYLKEENVKFRNYSIKFEQHGNIHKKRIEILTSWENVEKRLGKFHLKAEKGNIPEDTVIGILGENGVGKTTFVKILADAIKQDTGEITKKVKVSYKAQYLDSSSEELVINLLSHAVQKYSNQLILPLNLKHLLNRKINELSGGELQRVAIALCLSRDAQIYLLDEPSAYLDVEQRVIVSKIIKEFTEQKGASALIVDHDLLFIDYLSHDLMVVDGRPAAFGNVKGPFSMEDGMHLFLSQLEISMRREPETNRPRLNKLGSVKDREQKALGKLYYI